MASEPVPYGVRLTQLAQARKDETALVFAAQQGGETEYSWEWLEQRANQIARSLQERAVGAGDVVVVALPNSPDHVVATFGAWKLGASVLPLRSDLPAWERSRLLEVAGPRLVIGEWDVPGLESVSWADLEASRDLDSAPIADVPVPQHSQLTATSGSTGTPKLIVHTEPALFVERSDDAIGNVSAVSGVVLGASPLYHTNGAASCFPPLLLGSKVVLMERFDAARAVDLIERYSVAGTILVPTMLQRIARLEGIKDRDLSSLKSVHYGGASLPEWVARTWLELVPPENFVFSYGGSERIGLSMCTGTEWLEHPGTSGTALNCDIAILDPDGKVLPPGEVGQIYMRGHWAGPGFHYVGVETPEPIMDGYRSYGDMGWLDEDGYLYIADRRQDMIVTGGVNVFPAEVEAALSEHADVVDAVVIGLPDPEWGHRVHAIIQVRDQSAPLDVEALRAFCKERLAGPKVPKSFEVLDILPRTTAGKLNRSRLIEERAPSVP